MSRTTNAGNRFAISKKEPLITPNTNVATENKTGNGKIKENNAAVTIIPEEEVIVKATPRKAPAKKKDSIEALFGSIKKEAGTTKSVYFEADVYEFCNNISTTYGTKFSAVVNTLIRQARQAMDNTESK